MNTHLRRAIDVWCSTFPRRATTRQKWVENAAETEKILTGGRINEDNHPHISVYGFPNGHPKDGNIPVVDTFFLDFDIPSSGEYRSDNPDPQAWYRDMSALLTRVRAVAKLLVEEGRDVYFRAALSGHKGVHLFLDFEPIELDGATVGQYQSGMLTYLNNLIAYLESNSGMELGKWLDVDSSDLSKLCRMPNTKHPGATRAFSEDRYCVPVSMKELRTIKPADYVSLTQSPRMIDAEYSRNPSAKAHSVITEYVRQASGASGRPGKTSQRNVRTIQEYEEQANSNIELEDVEFLTSKKPCIWAFRERDDMFNHGAKSHQMELNVVANLVSKNIPVDVILEFFNTVPEFSEGETLERIRTVLSRDYSEFSCETIWQKADEFCLGDKCQIYRSEYEEPSPADV